MNASKQGLENGSAAQGPLSKEKDGIETMLGCIVARLKWLGQMVLTLVNMRVGPALSKKAQVVAGAKQDNRYSAAEICLHPLVRRAVS